MKTTPLPRLYQLTLTMVLLIGLLISCAILKPEKIYPGHFAETKLSFSDGPRFIDHGNLYKMILTGVHPNMYFNREENWFRDSTNIYMSYHTLKKIGLETLIPEEQYFDTITSSKIYSLIPNDFYDESLSSLLHSLG